MKKIVLGLILALLWGGNAYAECIQGNCVNGLGTYIWPSGHTYVGEWKDGKKHGQGTFTDVSEDKYVGEWKDGKRDGQGTATRANGYKYVGQWKDGIKYDQAAEILGIEKAKDDKIKEEKLLEKYNLFLDIEYADKKGFEILKKLLPEMGKCSYGAAILEAKVNLHSGVSRDIDKWIARADNAIYYNNEREMRITHGWLRRLAHEAFSSVATSYGVDNPTARFCKSLDINYEFKSTEFAVWKNKRMN